VSRDCVTLLDKLTTNSPGLCESAKTRFLFGQNQRLLTASEYKAVFDYNTFRASHKHALMLARLNERSSGRLGLVISKKNVRRSVDRNRIKRIAREQFRLQQNSFKGCDMIIMARSGLAMIDKKGIVAIINQLIENIRHQHTRKLGS